MLTADEAWSLEQLGHLYMSRGKDTQARAIFAGLTTLAPTRAYAWKALGLLAQRAGEVTQATSYLQHVLKLDPADEGARLLLGELLVSQRQLQQARGVLAPLRRSASDPHVARRGAALLARCGGR